jgi:hypothetical protein
MDGRMVTVSTVAIRIFRYTGAMTAATTVIPCSKSNVVSASDGAKRSVRSGA